MEKMYTVSQIVDCIAIIILTIVMLGATYLTFRKDPGCTDPGLREIGACALINVICGFIIYAIYT